MRALLELRGQGERVPGLMYAIVRRVRDAHEIAVALEAGRAPRRSRAACACRRSPPTA